MNIECVNVDEYLPSWQAGADQLPVQWDDDDGRQLPVTRSHLPPVQWHSK